MEERPEVRPPVHGRFYIPARSVFVIMGFCGFFNVYAMRVNLSVALVAMVNNTIDIHDNKTVDLEDCTNLIDNATLFAKKQYVGKQYHWDTHSRSIILESFFYGYCITQLPGGTMAEKLGAKWLFGGGVLMTSVLSLATPWAADRGRGSLITVRILEGLFEGVTFPAMNAAISTWSPKFERSRVSTLIYTGALAGNIFAYPICGYLCSTSKLGGWPSVFYLFGTVGVVWFLLWTVLVFENPASHPRISLEERLYIESHNGKHDDKDKDLSVPWKAIFKSIPFWTLIITHFGHNLGFLMLLTELPTYMSSVLHFDMKKNGLISALPYICQSACAWTISYVADVMRSARLIETTLIRKVFNTIGLLGPAICMLGITVSGCRPILIVTLICLALGTNGCIYSGFNITHVDMSPDFAGTLYGITNTVSNLGGIIGPAMVGHFTRTGTTMENWNKVFYITSAVYIAATFIFIFLGSAQVQPWGIGACKRKIALQNLIDDATSQSSISTTMEVAKSQ